MWGASCLQMGRVWQRHGEGADFLEMEGGLCKSLTQGWAPVPHLEALAGSAGALAAPWVPAPPLSHTCTPPTTTWMVRPLAPSGS